MTTRIHVVDPGIHASVLDSLGAHTELHLQDSPNGAAALVTQNVPVSRTSLDTAGDALTAIFVLEPGTAEIASTSVPIHAIENPALMGVAEHAILMMLALAKRLPWVLEKTRRGEWSVDKSQPALTTQTDYCYNWIDLETFGTLSGRTIGLVGLGYIGQATARMLRGFAARVIYHTRTRLPADTEAALGVTWCSLDTLLEESDYVSLHHRFVDGPGGNDAQFGADAFRRMRRTACLINTARGRLVDEDALCHAIESGEIAGAALDVFRYEPLPSDHPFFRVPPEKLILTPHLAGVPMLDATGTVTRRIVEMLTNRSE